MDIRIVEEAKKPLGMNPKKFALYLFMTSVVMLFAAWTSAYFVKRADAGWSEIILPPQFWINTIVISSSSISMILAQRAARRDQLKRAKTMLAITTILGAAFLLGQFLAYGDLVRLNEYFTGGNVSHSFIYVLTGAHGFHIVSGLIFLGVVLDATHRHRIHSGNMAQMEMCSTYWHFLGILWLYLYGFLILNP